MENDSKTTSKALKGFRYVKRLVWDNAKLDRIEHQEVENKSFHQSSCVFQTYTISRQFLRAFYVDLILSRGGYGPLIVSLDNNSLIAHCQYVLNQNSMAENTLRFYRNTLKNLISHHTFARGNEILAPNLYLWGTSRSVPLAFCSITWYLPHSFFSSEIEPSHKQNMPIERSRRPNLKAVQVDEQGVIAHQKTQLERTFQHSGIGFSSNIEQLHQADMSLL